MYTAEFPKPILFHPLKHHLHYIREFIRLNTRAEAADLKAAFLTIGNSQLDIYTGELTAQQLAQEVINKLQERALLSAEAYRLYLTAAGSDYRMIRLSDGSDWVLRWGVVAERYVHLHPARYAKNTIRVKANTLKTAMATLLANRRFDKTEVDLQLINQVRLEWLGLAPVKHFKEDEGPGKLIKKLG